MFDIAWSEFLVVAVVALVVVGPRDLPALLRTVGKTVASLRRMAGEFQSQFHEAMREAELDDLKNEVTGLKDKASKFVGASPFEIARNEIRGALEGKPSALAGDAAKADADAPSALAPAPEIAPPEEPSSRPDEDAASEAEKSATARAEAARDAASKAPSADASRKPASEPAPATAPATEKKPDPEPGASNSGAPGAAA